MKLRELFERIDKDKMFIDRVYIPDFVKHFELSSFDFEYTEQNRLISYFFGSWYCTDTYVGYRAYFLDDKPVAVSTQSGRKMSEDIEWVSEEAYHAVKKYVMTLKIEPDPIINTCDLDEEIGDSYKIHYHGQLFEYHMNKAKLSGENVKIIECHNGNNHNEKKQYEPSLVKIVTKSKEEKWVELKELDFPFNVTSK